MSPTLLFLLCLAAPAPKESDRATRPARRDEWQYLSRYFTVDGFAESRPRRTEGLDGVGNSYSTGFLPGGERLVVPSDRYGPIPFLRPPTDGSKKNMVQCEGQEIRVSTKRIFNVLFSLGMAHHGEHFGWVEFTFEDGTKGRGPIGFSDWFRDPLMGEDGAFTIPIMGYVNNPPGGGPQLWLQRTPIPAAKRVVSIKLPDAPNVKILALTLSWRDGIRPILPPQKTLPSPGPVAIFGEEGFPHVFVRGDLRPKKIQEAFGKAGISAAILAAEHVKDPEIFNPEAYPVFINPFGNTFPIEAEETLRAYRKAGGAMIHLSVPFTRPAILTPYGNWIDRGHSGEFMAHDGERAMGTGAFASMPASRLMEGEGLEVWGLKGVEWNRFLPRGADLTPHASALPQVLQRSSLSPEDEVLPLLKPESSADLFACLVRHRSCPFDGATDLWLGHICFGFEHLETPLELTTELILRGAAFILHEKKLIDDDTWSRVSRPLPESLRVPGALEPVLPDPDGDWRMLTGPPAARRVSWVDVSGLSNGDKVLLASAQGLVNRSGGEISVFLVDGTTSRKGLEWYRTEGFVDELAQIQPEELIDLVGHRMAVVVDPDLWGSLNLAVTVAAAEGVLVAYPESLRRYRLEAAADLRGLFRSAAEGYEWALENVWPQLDHRCTALVEPDPSRYAVVDYLVARRVFTCWIVQGRNTNRAGSSWEAECAAVSRLLARAPVATPVVVVPTTGNETSVAFLSRFGKCRVPLNYISNLSFSSGVRIPLPEPEPPGAVPPGETPAASPQLELDKVYHAGVSPGYGTAGLIEALDRKLVTAASLHPRAASLVTPWIEQLLPAQVSRLRAARKGRCLGSDGLGQVDCVSLGAAYGEAAAQVRGAYWKSVDRSMKELGLEFFVLRGWSEPEGEEIAACAAALESAKVILAALDGDTSGNAPGLSYVLHDKPVVHSIPDQRDILSPEKIAGGSIGSLRPFFSWNSALSSGKAGPVAAEVLVVTPLELADLCREYHAKFRREKVSLVTAGATWRYEDSGKDLGKEWRSLEYDDSAWSSGAAELGYGDASAGQPEKTEISYGPDESNKHITTYFRHEFQVDDPARLRLLNLEIVRDDGCVAYLNGHEVARGNLPEGDISFDTLAQSAVGGADESVWNGFSLKANQLRKGKNVLAVEMHQANRTSSDLSFDLRLTSYKETKKEVPPVETEP